MYTITYHKQSKSYSVTDSSTGKTLFRAWTEGLCQDFINDHTR